MQMTRLEDLTPSPSMEHSSRPTLGFPLGTALLLLVIFALSGMFSCCYHWDKLRALLRSRHPDMFLEAEEHTAVSVASSSPPRKAVSGHKLERSGEERGVPVIIMPGDKVPKFLAMARPSPRGPEAAAEKTTECRDHQEPSVSICIHDESTVSC
ncbi:hypothetical protein Zm00014a_034442 [Zea mays]|nr:hypothetical protein Zm00014a_034442 [Zea mays]